MEAKISWEITRQAPVASDLRFLLSVLKIARDFERAHRSVVHIAARATTASSGPAHAGAARRSSASRPGHGAGQGM